MTTTPAPKVLVTRPAATSIRIAWATRRSMVLASPSTRSRKSPSSPNLLVHQLPPSNVSTSRTARSFPIRTATSLVILLVILKGLNNARNSGVTGNSLSDSFCSAQKTAFGDTNTFASKGGLAGMSEAASAGMVLVMSLWDDYAAEMLWLDAPYPPTKAASSPGVTRGTCSASSGVPSQVESASPNAQVIYSNIKFGPIGSTFAEPA